MKKKATSEIKEEVEKEYLSVILVSETYVVASGKNGNVWFPNTNNLRVGDIIEAHEVEGLWKN